MLLSFYNSIEYYLKNPMILSVFIFYLNELINISNKPLIFKSSKIKVLQKKTYKRINSRFDMDETLHAYLS